jgi:ABC-type protease/lipase transport system fused ATPase/permease subunit
MKDAIDRITRSIRSRSKQEWQEYFSGYVTQIRDFVKAEGEKAAIVAFCLGIFIVIFYKLTIVLACLGLVAYQLILIISDRSSD